MKIINVLLEYKLRTFYFLLCLNAALHNNHFSLSIALSLSLSDTHTHTLALTKTERKIETIKNLII